MASFCKVSEFDPNLETWTAYSDRLTAYFSSNEVTDAAKQRDILISVVGAKTYGLMRNLVSPDKPTAKSYEELVKLMEEHFNPKPSPIVQRFKFNTCFRQPGQSIGAYVAELRKFAEHCDYGQGLDTMLRDRLVCGVTDDRIQRRLLSETDLTFKKALELSQAIEAANKNMSDLQSHSQSPAGNKKESQAVNYLHHKKKQHKGGKNKPRPTNQQTPKSDYQSNGSKCYRCGDTTHLANTCRFKDSVCGYCHVKGHILKACRRRKHRGTNMVEDCTEDTDRSEFEHEDEYTLYSVEEQLCVSIDNPPITVQVIINGKPVKLQLDTGATKSLITLSCYKKTWQGEDAPLLQKSSSSLRSYTGQNLDIAGYITVDVEYQGQKFKKDLLVVDNSKETNLLGRDWLSLIPLNFNNINEVNLVDNLDQVLDKHSVVFEEGYGKITGVKGSIYVDPIAQPKFFKPRPVPYAMRGKVDEELDRLLNEGIIEPVQFSEWATPIVPVLKSNGKVRICGDYKVTINQVAKLDPYPIPKIKDLYASLSGGQKFTKIDLKSAYLQLPLDEKSRNFTTINTHRGLFRFNRLPFGISSAPAIFQRCMDNLLQGIPMTSGYQDDILISGKNDSEHVLNTDSVLNRLSTAGVRVQKEKCTFRASKVTYLGHVIDSEGLHPVKDKVDAITNAPAPTDVTELKSYLGLLNYYGRFMPNLSTILTGTPAYTAEEGQQVEMGSGSRASICEIKNSTQVLASSSPL